MVSLLVEKINGFFRYKYVRNQSLRKSGLSYALPIGNSDSSIGYLGWVGYGNYGDDVIFKTLESTFNQFPLKIADAVSVFETLVRRKRVEKCMSAYMLGGGTLIFRSQYIGPVEELVDEKKALFCFGTGVADTEYWKKSIDSQQVDSISERWISALKKFEYIGVRGPLSKLMLETKGVSDVEVIGDSALALGRHTKVRRHEGKTIGISVGAHDPVEGGQDVINEVLERFVVARSLEGFKIRFLQFSPMDYMHAKKISDRAGLVGADFISFDGNISSFSNAIADCDFVVGERLHSVVIAAAFGVPFVALSYQPKCVDFARSIDCEEYLLNIDGLSFDRLNSAFSMAWEDRKIFREKLIAMADYYSEKQIFRAREIGFSLGMTSGK